MPHVIYTADRWRIEHYEWIVDRHKDIKESMRQQIFNPPRQEH